MEKSGTHKKIAYISNGYLYYVDLETGQHREISCEFGEKMKDRIVRTYENKEWRYRSNQQSIFSAGYSLWSGNQVNNPLHGIRAAISGAVYVPEEKAFLFSFEGEEANGLFSVDVNDFHEKRLFHSPHVQIRHLALSPTGKKIAYSCINTAGYENLFVLDKGTNQKVELTEGDSIDTAPSWSHDEQKILYQSAGIGRNAAGFEIALSSFEIFELDLIKHTSRVILSIPNKDLYLPRYSADGGRILAIAKPNQSQSTVRSIAKNMLSFILIPLRLLFALFEWLNFFVARYTGKPMLETNHYRRKLDLQQILLQGQNPGWEDDLDQDELDEEAEKTRAPRDWKLIEYDLKTAQWRVLVNGVSTYDIAAEDGSILYSDGRDIFKVNADGQNPERLATATFIHNVLWC
ncbi:PD40 domain-containing protein [bacterium]|nr:PD40 domain-containing protein [bacterium]